ncbi:MAG: TIM barrel protein [Phycisphaerae bacterium]|nr:TIM barrel protein [Phycisphaerae bacterium]
MIDLRPQAARRDLDARIEHLRTFELDLKFSAGIWFFSPSPSRFHEPYSDPLEIERRLEIAAGLKGAGLGALEAHYPNEIHEGNLGLWRDFCAQTGIKVLTVIPLLFWDRRFEFGSLSSPVASARKDAIERTKAALRLNRELETEFAVVWPGIDGYENPFGHDFASLRDRFVDGLAEAMDAEPGVRIAFEPKPYEPRGRILFGTTPEGVLLGRMVESRLRHAEHRAALSDGHALVCMNPEVGHVLMGFEDLAYALSWPLSEGRLAHTHWNSQPLGNYDQDLNVGVVSPEQAEAGLYALKMHGYRGWFGIDINPERMPVATALRLSMDALRSASDRINGLDHASIAHALEHPAESRGWVEGHLIRARSARPERFDPLPPLRG